MKISIIKKIICFGEVDLSCMNREDLFNKLTFELRIELGEVFILNVKVWGKRVVSGRNICVKFLRYWVSGFFLRSRYRLVVVVVERVEGRVVWVEFGEVGRICLFIFY